MGNLLQLAPTILSFLGGPAGGLAGAALQWLVGKTGAKASTVSAVTDALSGMTAEDTIAVRKLDIEFQEFCMDNNIKVDMAQLAVDDDEAKSTNWFVAGWRPGCGWICVLAFSYVALIEPFARFIATVGFHYSGGFPAIDTTLTMQVLLGMLGMGAMRSFEKSKGVS